MRLIHVTHLSRLESVVYGIDNNVSALIVQKTGKFIALVQSVCQTFEKQILSQCTLIRTLIQISGIIFIP